MEDYDCEVDPTVFHYNPEAFEDEDWEKSLQDSKVTPEQLKVIAQRISTVRQTFLQRALQLQADLSEQGLANPLD